jgi:DNA-binding response OmpR family regulator
MTASILVVDDEPLMQDALEVSLSSQGYRVATATSGEEALARIEAQEFDVIVSDLVLPGLDGLAVLERSRTLNPRAGVILMTAFATLETAIAAFRQGACDYLEKPFDIDDLTRRVQRVLREREEDDRRGRLVPRPPPRTAPHHVLVGESDSMRAVRGWIARSAATSSNVLITGESGVGRSGRPGCACRQRPGPGPSWPSTAAPFGDPPRVNSSGVRGAFTTALQTNPDCSWPPAGTVSRRIGSAFPASPAAAGHRTEGGVPRRRHQVGLGGRAHHRQHEPRPRGRDHRRPLPRGSL